MTKQDILDASDRLKLGKAFTHWLGFELEHEDVTDKSGKIINENVSGDSGGLTFAGIDKSSHKDFPYSNPQPVDVVAAYLVDWNAVKADQLPDPVGATVANFGVNMGTGPAVKLLQDALNTVIDGSIGPKTIAASTAFVTPLRLALNVIALADTRYDHLAENNASLRKFLRGWKNRDNDLREYVKAEVA